MGALIDAYFSGGVFMHPIAVCSLVGIAIIAERFMVINAASNVKKDELLNHINSYVLQGNLEKAVAVTSQVRSPLTNIVRAGLVAVVNGKGAEDVQTAMDAVALREVPKIEKRIGLLSSVSNIATLLGLLGTVTGLIAAFASVANAPPDQKAQMLADSIAVAMNTTAFGLIVAIPLLGAYGWLNSWAQSVVDDIHESSVATLNFILSNKSKLTGT
ncbi:MAG: MotA/TolQ/ExbB proton channel family protein [Bdellovibrionales bacterium]|nr:MotA/TolQ/ExbB proton channel family protein [Bdellovibrionales bacterium]